MIKSQVVKETISEGDGTTFPKPRSKLSMHYVGTYHLGSKHGQEFDSSVGRGKEFAFQIGVGQVIRGWDEGVMQMSLGEKAFLKIGYEYGYGERGHPAGIPAKQDLLFEVTLLEIDGVRASK